MKAWRVWNLDSAEIRLVSALDPKRATNPTYWEPGINRAICKFHDDHAAPVESCRCGFRAQQSRHELITWLYDVKGVGVHVFGMVALSGKVLTGDHAHPEIPRVLRAEYAEVCGPLYVWGGFARVCRILARKYGVPVIPVSGAPNNWCQRIP